MNQLALFNIPTFTTASKTKVVNVASVPQRSPFRYPGGKTWFIPTLRKWLSSFQHKQITLVEPFAGGGIVSLTAAFENLAHKVIMVERDEEVAAVWHSILNSDNQWLAGRILGFDLTIENVSHELARADKGTRDLAFCTILKNRVFHGGIITKGSGFLKKGENGKGIASRWYAKTLHDRIRDIDQIKHKIEFIETDAFQILEQYRDQPDYCFFIDPPYVKAGKRLYTYFDIDHEKLFEAVAKLNGNFVMTYDDQQEIRDLAQKYNFAFTTIPMKTTHHLQKQELIISNNLEWL